MKLVIIPVLLVSGLGGVIGSLGIPAIIAPWSLTKGEIGSLGTVGIIGGAIASIYTVQLFAKETESRQHIVESVIGSLVIGIVAGLCAFFCWCLLIT